MVVVNSWWCPPLDSRGLAFAELEGQQDIGRALHPFLGTGVLSSLFKMVQVMIREAFPFETVLAFRDNAILWIFICHTNKRLRNVGCALGGNTHTGCP